MLENYCNKLRNWWIVRLRISGYRLDNKDKPELHTFEIYHRTMKGLTPLVDIGEMSREQFDTLADILTLNTDFEGIREALQNQLPNVFDEEQVKGLVSLENRKTNYLQKGGTIYLKKLCWS